MKTDKLFTNIAALSLLYFFSNVTIAQQLGSAIQGKMSMVQTTMTTVGAIAVTISLVYVGLKMVFQAAEWKDVAPVFWGGVLIGGAGIIGGFLTRAA
jgi:type IV secretion system protein VirB2